MSEMLTGTGTDDWKVEWSTFLRRWNPTDRAKDASPDVGGLDFVDIGGDDLGALVLIPVFIVLGLLLVLLLPVFVFAVEVLLVLLVIAPVYLLLCGLGALPMQLHATNARTGEVVGARARGYLGYRRQRRTWREQLAIGARPEGAIITPARLHA